jgi:hypothetical protein
LWEVLTDRFTEPTEEEEAEYTGDEKKALKEQRKKDKKLFFYSIKGWTSLPSRKLLKQRQVNKHGRF